MWYVLLIHALDTFKICIYMHPDLFQICIMQIIIELSAIRNDYH